MEEKWIQSAIRSQNKGKLHKALGVKPTEKIPEKKLKAAEKKGGKVAKEATLAQTLKNLRKKK